MSEAPLFNACKAFHDAMRKFVVQALMAKYSHDEIAAALNGAVKNEIATLDTVARMIGRE